MEPTVPLWLPNFPGYETLRQLGRGGMGEVYLVRKLENQELRAIKRLSPQAGLSPAGRRLAERFARESALMTRLSHPNIVRVLDQGVQDRRELLVLEYVDGCNLRRLIEERTSLTPPRCAAILRDLGAALAFLESQDVIHRDLKPENVLIAQDGSVKVTDFGISTTLGQSGRLTESGEVMGTYDYMSPEQRSGLPLDARSDQYSLAVIAYEMLAGKRPIGSFRRIAESRPELSPRIDDALARALRENREDRFPTTQAFLGALLPALLDRRHRWRRRIQQTSLVAGVAGCAALAALGVRHLLTPTPPPPTPPEPVVAIASPPSGERPHDAVYFVQLGDQHLEEQHPLDAEAAYSEAIRLAPRDVRALQKRALLYKQRALYQKALDDLDRVLKIDPQSYDAILGRGTIYVALKDHGRAVAELDWALKIYPAGAEALAYRGWAQHALKRHERAVADLDEAICLDVNCGIAYHFRALIHISCKREKPARDDFRQAARCMPDNPYTHAGLAQLLATCEDAEVRDASAALTHACRACELTRHRDWRHLRVLARAHFANEEYARAVEIARQAIDLAPALEKRGLTNELERYRKALGDDDMISIHFPDHAPFHP